MIARPQLVLGVLAAVVLLAGCASQAGQPAAGLAQPADGAEKSAEAVADRIDRCETTHQLHQAQELRKGSDGSTYDWLSCTWPATTDADADGFTHIHVDVLEGPGESDASDS